MNTRNFVVLVATAATAAVALLPLAASAQSDRADIHNRLVRQHERMHAGLEHGTMTHNQARHLMARDARIHARAMGLRAHDGGALTNRQRRHLNERLNHVSHRIYKDKHPH